MLNRGTDALVDVEAGYHLADIGHAAKGACFLALTCVWGGETAGCELKRLQQKMRDTLPVRVISMRALCDRVRSRPVLRLLSLKCQSAGTPQRALL
jgi:hypothetical protein